MFAHVPAAVCIALALSTLACSGDVRWGAAEERSRPRIELEVEISVEVGGGGGGGSDAGASQPEPCDDGDPCTLDEHPPGYCVHTWRCGEPESDGGEA